MNIDVNAPDLLEEICDDDPLARVTGGAEWPWAVTGPRGLILGFDTQRFGS